MVKVKIARERWNKILDRLKDKEEREFQEK